MSDLNKEIGVFRKSCEITSDEDKVIARLKQGEIVALPTETVYGLAAIASKEEAVKKVYEFKQRPLDHPLILHVASQLDLSFWVKNISSAAITLMDAFWPGPLTLVFEKNNVLDCITAGQNTVAVRCPQHPATQRILKALGEPLVMPSANPFGKVSPTTAQHVKDSFQDKDLLILDGGRCKLGIESTILSAVDTSFGKILRHGALDKSLIDKLLKITATSGNRLLQKLAADDELRGESERKTAVYTLVHEDLSTGKAKQDSPLVEFPKKSNVIKVPGQPKKHYQPEKPVFIFANFNELIYAYQQKEQPIFVFAFHKTSKIAADYFCHLSSNPAEVAFELYNQLRNADKSEAKAIYIELPPAEEKWAAITDRIIKAATN